MRIRARDHVLHANSTLVDRVDLPPRYHCPLNRLPASRLLLPRSGLERSDFVPWPDADLCNPALMSAVWSDADTTIPPGAAAVERDDHGLGLGRRHCDHWS